MARYKSILYTTEADSLGVIKSLAELQRYEKQINTGAVRESYVSHVHILPPKAKGERANIEAIKPGVYALVVEFETFEQREEIELSTGLKLVRQSTDDKRPFDSIVRANFPADGIVAALEERCFPDEAAEDQFLEGLNEVEKTSLRRDQDRALIIDQHTILLLLGAWYIRTVGGKLVDKAIAANADAIVHGLGGLRRLAGQALKQWKICATPSTEPPVLLLRLEVDPILELVYVGEDTDWTSLGLTEQSLEPIFQQMEQLKQEQNAVFVQYQFAPSGAWELNYALTATGDTISSNEKLAERDQKFRDYEEKCAAEGRTIGLSGKLAREQVKSIKLKQPENKE